MSRRERNNRMGCTLTHRQRKILQLRADGLNQRQVSDRLGLHVTTCDDHLLNARLRLDARTTVHAVALAIREGVIR